MLPEDQRVSTCLFTDRNVHPSQRVRKAREMRDAAIADARAQSEGQVAIVTEVVSD